MSDILQRLAECEQVIEWVDRHDERLAVATGESVPNDGGSVRERWQVEEGQETAVAEHVRRLLVGQNALAGTVEAALDLQSGSVVLRFNEGYDWPRRFPIGEQTRIPDVSGRPTWAAVALCGQLGLAVFSQQTETWSAEVRVQPVPDDIFRRIVSSEQ